VEVIERPAEHENKARFSEGRVIPKLREHDAGNPAIGVP
jgi:hypothetical protein